MTTLPQKWVRRATRRGVVSRRAAPCIPSPFFRPVHHKELLGRQTLAITNPDTSVVGIKSDPSTAPIFSTTYSKSDKMNENVSHEQLKQSIQLETNTNKITHAHTYARTGAHRPIDDDFDFNSNTYDYALRPRAHPKTIDNDSDSDSDSDRGWLGATELGLTAATGSDSDSDSDSDNGNVGIGTTSPEPETSSQPELLDISNLANDELDNFGQMYGFEKRRFYVFNTPLNLIPYNKCMRPFAQDCPYPHTHTHTHGRPLLLDERDKLGEWYGRQPRKHTLILRYWTRRRGRRGQRFHALACAREQHRHHNGDQPAAQKRHAAETSGWDAHKSSFYGQSFANYGTPAEVGEAALIESLQDWDIFRRHHRKLASNAATHTHAPSFAPLRIAGQCAHGSSCP